MTRPTWCTALGFAAVLLSGASAPGERAATRPPRSRIAVASVRAAPGSVVRLPVELVDRSGTPLGAERTRGGWIQGVSLRVRCLPCAGVSGIAVERAGELLLRPPIFEARPTGSESASLVAAFGDGASPLFAGARARSTRWQIATVVVSLDSSAPLGNRIELRLDPAATSLSNRNGEVSETASNGWLELGDGEIVVGRKGKGGS